VNLFLLGRQPYFLSIFQPNYNRGILQNEKSLTLNKLLLHKTEITNGMGNAFYCTIYQFSVLFLTDKLVSQSPR